MAPRRGVGGRRTASLATLERRGRRSSEVEQAAHNRCVGGSIPPAATNGWGGEPAGGWSQRRGRSRWRDRTIGRKSRWHAPTAGGGTTPRRRNGGTTETGSGSGNN